ncbi:MAG: hypothetical protein ABI162_09360, partial [Luteolibacter sp.]
DMLFVIDEIYEWQNNDELAIAACWLEKYEEARLLFEKLLRFAGEGNSITFDNLQRIKMNLEVAKAGCPRTKPNNLLYIGEVPIEH